jgi:poly(hydroxyalkanoate) depolymerase family esterase
MKFFSNSDAPSFDAASITDTIERALASAGLDTTSGPMRDVTDTIRRALSRGGPAAPAAFRDDDPSIVDVEPRGVVNPPEATRPAVSEPGTSGTFTAREFTNHAGTRAYKVYVPAKPSDAPRPMVVMLHGCTQSADDFAAGTGMNRLADEHGFLVVYPEQAPHANPSKCWNWFKPQDQVRDAGEPSLIAGIVGEVAARHGADPRRVFVAGLSAGAAMAVVLGETYPEVFAGVGAHSGLPYGSAYDIPSAMLAMKGGHSGMPNLQNLPGAAAGPRRKPVHAVPTIVFHGDRDHTVQPSNAAQIVQEAIEAHAAEAGTVLQPRSQSATSAGGRSYSRTLHVDANGQSRIEAWTLHGAGHAWAGGDASGSYTDGRGPDASAEMVRFFLAQPRAGSA